MPLSSVLSTPLSFTFFLHPNSKNFCHPMLLSTVLSTPLSFTFFLPPNSKNLPSIIKTPNAVSVSANNGNTSKNPNERVLVIGAGLAGLAAATRLQAENISFTLLEASDDVGGRVRTDFVDGFTLDRGFQIFITAYPEAQKLLDYNALELQRFYSGAQVYYDGRFHVVADPLRHFSDALRSLTNPIGTVFDKLLIGLTTARVLTKSDYDILTSNDETETIDLLRSRIGFSESILDRFFRPFFGGVFFDRELETTSRLFNFVFKCLALGDNTIPKAGISAIPKQLAGKLDKKSIRLNSKVVSIDYESEEEGTVVVNLENGEMLKSDLGVIIAIEQFEATKILSKKVDIGPIKKPVRSTICVYFSVDSDKVPVNDPVLFLNGSGRGIVNNMFFASNVAPSYAPPGKALVSVSLIGIYDDVSDEELVELVVKEMSDWFGEASVKWWRYLRMYRIVFAQPNQCPPSDLMKDHRLKLGLYICGDYVTSATFDGALVSGRRAVEALMKDRAIVRV